MAIFSFCAGVITGAETSLRRALAILCDLKAEGRAPNDFADQLQDLEGELRLLADAP